MKITFLFVIIFIGHRTVAQELFVMTDPASNVPANSLSINVMQSLLKKRINDGYNYHAMPEITYGLNKNLMFRATGFLSNTNRGFNTEGLGLYTKYRFLSSDDLNSHFRMAVYGRYSFNKSPVAQEQIEIMGFNSGFETGIVATKLIDKIAISTSYSFEKVNLKANPGLIKGTIADNASNYTLSFGKLMYPKKYKSYKQTNINLMVEFIGQTLNENGKSYLDVIPAIQFIINSQARIDLAYRQELASNMIRTTPNGFYFNLYFTFFNVTS